MFVEAVAARPLLGRLQKRTRRLEMDLFALRSDVGEMSHSFDCPVATYVVDGEKFVITEGNVAAVRAQLVRPCSDEAAQELALADKLAERDKDLPEAEIRRLLAEDIKAIRAEAIAKGIAIDDPMEAVVGD